MTSFRQSILQQIERIEPGHIFTFRDLSYELDKTANVAVLLSELSRAGDLMRAAKGAYYRPKKSALGLGNLPIYQTEQFRYLAEKLNGYLTGPYVYNKMGLTEQVSMTITMATPSPARRFLFHNLEIECVKSYCPGCQDESSVPYLQVLDAIKDMKRVPGTTAQDIYDRVKVKYFAWFSSRDLKYIVSLSKNYPPRVRKVVSDILGDIGQPLLSSEIALTILPTTRFNLNYKRHELTFGQGSVLRNHCSGG